MIENIIEKLDKETEKRIKQSPHPNNKASEVGHPCIKFLVLSRLKSELKPLHDVGLQRIFDEGNLHEKAVLRELEDARYKVIEQQRFYEWKKLQLSGHIDGKIRMNGQLIPIDVKSCSPNIFPVIKNSSIQDMLGAKYFWIRKYPAQILMYMLMGDSETGILLFKNKTTGQKCQKNINLNEHLEYSESILKKLEIVNDYVARNEIPETEQIDECRKCPFMKTFCFPDQDYGPGFEFYTDEELEAKLLRREELSPYAKEYKEINEELKKQLKGKSIIIGDFKIESKPFERKSYQVPDEVKEKYLEMDTYYRLDIEKLDKKD